VLTRSVLAPLAIGVAAAVAVLAPAGAALAAPVPDHGDATTPAQPFSGNPNMSDWLGSYLIAGTPSWDATFGNPAPDATATWTDAGALVTKWSTAVDATTAAQLSYLLVAYGSTASDDDAAAIAYLTDVATSSPQNPGQLDPSNDFRHIAFDAPFHLPKLRASAQARVAALQTESAALAGPWTLQLTAPASAQIGSPATWTIRVVSASGSGVPNVPVTLTATDGAFTGARTAARRRPP
jgi:hypothetical protein